MAILAEDWDTDDLFDKWISPKQSENDIVKYITEAQLTEHINQQLSKYKCSISKISKITCIDNKGKNWTASLTCSDEQIKDESFEIVNKFKESYSAVW
ncbi:MULTISPECIES: hypothetical protein [Acidithiobacillus]|uniref:hypothetical protein n=1 Tax=Acidithiobacillus TaxID=119977 RepID=UPI000FA0B0E6|nr:MULTISPECIES: hypothetical protein [Acidithiobacillus]MBN6745593.1 hypothetical protein [Acidithiobacillus sp. MC2.2]MBN6748565.1 hypothetical protein [Acidithiobacillus sp. PG05]MBU2774543.1 hypothetical protein [Acidithiobacillus ferrooxidans]MCR0970390.1 hypothetical protein [Acidithiobacillus ferrooxidans]MCR1343055.1 hypothetical protein [Acidithiobacillus ferrooxidans]